MQTELLPTATAEDLEFAAARAVALLGDGHPVALPTETVYGLAADALRPDAVLKIFEAKERPFFDPLICHLPDLCWLDRMANVPDESRPWVETLTARFWPGPLTLVLPRREIVPDLVTAGLETVALRISAHPVFRRIVGRFQKPLAAPSANRFGRISPTAAGHVLSELGGRIPLVVDGGTTVHGIESTIVAVEGSALRLLRAGPIIAEELGGAWLACCEDSGKTPSEKDVAAFIESLGVSGERLRSGSPAIALEAPGQMKSHYAPRTRMELVPRGAHPRPSSSETFRTGRLAFRTPSNPGEYADEEILSPSGDLREAAATLFSKLRRLDAAGLDLILAEPVPEHGLGIAIMDRLRRAAGKGNEG